MLKFTSWFVLREIFWIYQINIKYKKKINIMCTVKVHSKIRVSVEHLYAGYIQEGRLSKF